MTENTIKFDVFIKGKLVDLVVLTEEIVEKTNWYNWFNDEEVTKNMQKHYYPNTKEMQMSFLRNEVEGNLKKIQLGIVNKKDQVMIGTISLNNIDYINRRCSASCVIGEKMYQSDIRNFFEAHMLIIKHAFESLNLNRIDGGTINKVIKDMLCRYIGFKSEGILRQCIYKHGKYHDIFLHSILYEDYLKIK